MDPRAFAVKAHSGGARSLPISNFEAQILVTATFIKSQQAHKADRVLGDRVREVLSRSGDLMALEEFHPAGPKESVYRAEFCSVDAANRLLLNGTWFEVDVSFVLSLSTCI